MTDVEVMAVLTRWTLKREIVAMGVRLVRSGLVHGTAGNISARLPGDDVFYITPSGMRYESLQAEDIVGVDYEGRVVEGKRRPSIERLLHAGILRARPDVAAVIHTHSPCATALATARQPIPPFLETIVALSAAGRGAGRGAAAGIDVADFAPAGSPELAANAARCLAAASAVLLASHGVVAVGRDLEEAFSACEAVEHAAKVFLMSRMLGGPASIPPEVVTAQAAFFRQGYGQRGPARAT